MKRAQTERILQDLAKKMVFLVGPRQVGKTWLAQHIARSFSDVTYLNYDSVHDRSIIHSESWLPSTELLILDELHKMPGWKNYLKGVYDTKEKSLKILVTDSARLDIMRQLGDSLAGRFHVHRLLPFSPAELVDSKLGMDLDRFIVRGGFPEPFLAESDVDANRWRAQYIDSLLQDDVFDIEQVHNLKAIRLVMELLRDRVGSPISYQSIAGDVGVSLNTVKKYIYILEALFIVFRVTPYAKNIARSLLKEPKIYFFDTGMVTADEGAKFENFVAVSLLKYAYEQVDYYGKEFALHYLRTKDGEEVDFAFVESGKVQQIIEAKVGNKSVHAALHAFNRKYNLPAMQIVKKLKREHVDDSVSVVKAINYLRKLIV